MTHRTRPDSVEVTARRSCFAGREQYLPPRRRRHDAASAPPGQGRSASDSEPELRVSSRASAAPSAVGSSATPVRADPSGPASSRRRSLSRSDKPTAPDPPRQSPVRLRAGARPPSSRAPRVANSRAVARIGREPSIRTPVTSAPSALAICTANVPTPPPAPLISTVIPGWTFPFRSACNAVTPACGAAAACSKVRFAGFGTIRVSGATTYSANVPMMLRSSSPGVPNTSSPTRKRVTLPPTASTRPARSRPGIVRLGLRIPEASRGTYGIPVRKCQSTAFTDAAWTRTNTSVSPTTGLATSRSSSQSGEPYRRWTIAHRSS